MIIKNTNDIRTDLLNELNTALPDLDLTEGTPERDMFVETPITGQLSGIWDGIIYAQKLYAPLVYYDDLEEDEINQFCSTYNVIQRPATYSAGTVTFYTSTEPVNDIVIADGSEIATIGANPVRFVVDGTYTLYAANQVAYYNAVNERWEITVSVRAINAGPDERTASGTVTSIISDIDGIDGVNNDESITGGEDAETVIERLRRVNEKFQGRDLGADAGLRSHIGLYTRYIDIVGANDPLMERDEGLGGAIDIYIIGEDLETKTDTVNITSTGLTLSTSVVNYTSTGITFEKQPVHQISGVVKNGTVLNTSYYTLSQDTEILRKSTQGFDKVLLTSTGISAIGPFADGDEVKITYNYNKMLHTIEEDLNSTGNHYQNRDYLLREMDKVSIAVYMKFKEVSGQDFDTVVSSVELEVSTFITGIKNTGDVQLADIEGIVKKHSGVDNVDLTTAAITPTGGGVLSTQGDILLGKNEYPDPGIMTFERWTS